MVSTAAGDGGERIRTLLREFLPSWFEGSLDDGVALGSSGLGLDSVAIVELLVTCEETFAVRFPDSILDSPPLTIGRLAGHLSAAGERRPDGPTA